MTPHTTARLSALSAQVAGLSVLGAALGVAILVVAGRLIFGSGGVEAFGSGRTTGVLTITAGDAGTGAASVGQGWLLTSADVDAVARVVPDDTTLSRAVYAFAPVAAADQQQQLQIQAVDPTFAQVTGSTVTAGTFFSAQDSAAANRVAVLGQTLSTRLFRALQNPLGATIRIRSVPFTVIGVLATASSALSPNADDAVLIPLQTGQVRLFGAISLDAVLIRAADVTQTTGVSPQVEQLLRQRHQVRAGQPDGFTIRVIRSTPAPASAVGTASQLVGQLLDRAWRYGCAAKGLCSSPMTE